MLASLFDACQPSQDVLQRAIQLQLGMAMHRKYPRRVLIALRFLLIEPGN